MNSEAEIQRRAKKKNHEATQARRDIRFLKTVGKLVHAKLLTAPGIPPYRGIVLLEEALWAAQHEYRILELLPAILIKRPKLFPRTGDLPEDLRAVILHLKKGEAKESFRGVPPKEYKQWVPRIGRRNKLPTLLKTFRFSAADLRDWKKLQKASGKPDVELLREALKLLLQKYS